MDWLCHFRAARLAAAALVVVTLTGCPELNQWSGPSPNPHFSVDDPAVYAPVQEDSEEIAPAHVKEVAHSTGWRAAS